MRPVLRQEEEWPYRKARATLRTEWFPRKSSKSDHAGEFVEVSASANQLLAERSHILVAKRVFGAMDRALQERAALENGGIDQVPVVSSALFHRIDRFDHRRRLR